MAIVRNSEALLELRRAAALQQGVDITPNMLGTQIIPTLELNPSITKKANIVRTVGTATILVVPTGKVFNMTQATVCTSKGAADTGTLASIDVKDGTGQTSSCVVIPQQTLVAEDLQLTCNFSPPLEIPASNINSSATGTFTLNRYTVVGFFTDSVTS